MNEAKVNSADEKIQASKVRLASLIMIWDAVRQYPKQLGLAALSLIVAALATLSIPAGFQRMIDGGFMTQSGGDISQYFEYMLMIVVVLAIATASRFYFVSWLGERVVADIRIKVQRNLLRLAPRFFEENRPAEISSRMTSDTAIIEQVVGTTISVALRNLFVGVGGVIYLFTLVPTLTAGLLIGIPVVILPIVFIGRRLEKASRSSQDRVADIGTLISEALGALKIVQAFGQQQREQERFASSVEQTFTAARRRIILRAGLTAIVIALIFGGIVMLMWRGAIGVQEGTITGGTIAAFVLGGGLVAGSFGALTEVYGDLVRGAGASSRLAELLMEVPEIAPPTRPVQLPEPPRGQLSFENIKFHYPTRPDVAALNNFTLRVDPGETVAIVGPSGAGKSTLFQLAQRFYDPEGGTVRLDGVGLTSADPADIRQRLAYVPQETILFASSARDNLRYGQWDASDDAIWDAAEQANAAEFLRALPNGLDTFLGEGGARLSGGQRQRIAIARALLRNSPILLLDEATSALDAESEQNVQKALDNLMRNRTTLVIAHRLATVRNADRIIVMDNGEIVEQGNHETLNAQDGLYSRLAKLQFNH
ncbi:ABC transporter [Sphingorhabdus lutea]|uniref:ABC transporter n=1 Tax=Sphingorhabdus lutea TaxID=1913578 RepID=A0A1L3JEL6_9SPHN|nr:ABC transporter [Sphingorhabdus lutea]